MKIEKNFENILKDITFVITYSPLKDECHPDLPVSPNMKVLTLPADRIEDPFLWGQRCIDAAGPKSRVAIIVPGRQFDLSGARCGRGAGWYDRFLSALPKTWMRIGVGFSSQLSTTLIKQSEWDQKMDALVLKD